MNQFLDKIHFTKVCAVIIVVAIYIALQGCAITATIQLPNGELAIYTGPQKAKMLLEDAQSRIVNVNMMINVFIYSPSLSSSRDWVAPCGSFYCSLSFLRLAMLQGLSVPELAIFCACP